MVDVGPRAGVARPCKRRLAAGVRSCDDERCSTVPQPLLQGCSRTLSSLLRRDSDRCASPHSLATVFHMASSGTDSHQDTTTVSTTSIPRTALIPLFLAWKIPHGTKRPCKKVRARSSNSSPP
ncbi:uncharacterized protein LOC144150057 [Haemaphysalis longicornis]